MDNKNDEKGFYHIQTGIYFPNRKAAVIIMGCYRYRKFLANGEFVWKK